MLAQIKSSDDDVWESLRKSGHLEGDPGDSLTGRLRRMRNWIDGQHFPSDAKIEIRSSISEDARDNLSEEQIGFLSALGAKFKDCDWTEGAIGSCIRSVATETGVGGRDAYVALYWAILGKSHGPKASSLIAEMESASVVSLISGP